MNLYTNRNILKYPITELYIREQGILKYGTAEVNHSGFMSFWHLKCISLYKTNYTIPLSVFLGVNWPDKYTSCLKCQICVPQKIYFSHVNVRYQPVTLLCRRLIKLFRLMEVKTTCGTAYPECLSSLWRNLKS